MWIRGYLAEGHLVRQDGEKFAPRDEEVADCRERSERAVAAIREHGYHVVGDVASLLVPADLPALPHPDEVDDAALLEAATALVAVMLDDVRTMKRELGTSGSDRGPDAGREQARRPEARAAKTPLVVKNWCSEGRTTARARSPANEEVDVNPLGGFLVQWRVAVVSATLVATILSVPAASADDGRNTIPVAEQVGAVGQAQPVKAAQARDKKRWRPRIGPVFNNPYGSDDARFRIERRILEAIRHSGKNDKIKIAIYSWDRIDMAKAVINARKRGAQVQILLNDHQVTRAQRMMKRAIGRNPNKKNFVYECVASCRGRRDNLHTKFYLFSSPGAATRRGHARARTTSRSTR